MAGTQNPFRFLVLALLADIAGNFGLRPAGFFMRVTKFLDAESVPSWAATEQPYSRRWRIQLFSRTVRPVSRTAEPFSR